MLSTLNSLVLDSFLLSFDRQYFICQCHKLNNSNEICGHKIGSSRFSNLKRHLSRFHPSFFNALNETNACKFKLNENVLTGGQPSLTNYFVSKKITITMDCKIFKKHIIDLVVENGLALSTFSQAGFIGLNGEMADKLGISLERESIRQLIIDEAAIRKQELKNILFGKLLFLKMDSATRHRVNYFAINARFLDDNGVITKTLAVKDTFGRHDSHYLRMLVETVLDDYGIKKNQILCIVTDNAANMIKLIEKINENDEFDSVDNLLEETVELCNIQHMRCAVHTLQLAIRDGLKDIHISNLIDKYRNLAISARTPKIDNILQRRAGKGAIIDQATRWGSTYLMLDRLTELQHFIEDVDNPTIALSDIEWEELWEIKSTLYPFFQATKRLQAEDLTAGCFLWEWKHLIYINCQKGGSIAEAITCSMKKRETLLLNNDFLLAAVIVDPKNRVLLTDEQIERAKVALMNIELKIRKINSNYDDSLNSPVVNLLFEDDSLPDDHLDFESYLNKIEKAKRRKTGDTRLNTTKLDLIKKEFAFAIEQIFVYNRSCNLSLNEIFELYPESLKNAAKIANALPPTQISVERLFSALKFIKSDLRSSMKEDLAEAIIFLRINK